jgi:predicted DNA-binding transcriptional regulator YafY
MRADRLLAALLLLQARGRMSGKALAKRLEVSARTLHRDMEALSAAGVPVYATRGSQGGWQLDPDWRTRVPALNDAELSALLMAQPKTAAAESAFAKLIAALPDAMRDRAAAIRQRLYVDITGWHGNMENLAMLPVVQDAVSCDRMLAIRYWKAGQGVVDRTVHPLGLVAKGSTWYLYAGTSNGPRTFRVSRIEHARVLDEPCTRPPGFDLSAAWKTATDEFQGTRPRFWALLNLHPSAARSVKLWRPWSDAGEGDEAGWTRLRVEFNDESEACFVILGLGVNVDVLEPASLRDRVAKEVTAMAARTGLRAASVAV